MVRAGLPERLLPLVLAAAFLAAGAGNPYGLHDCPHHDPAAGAAHVGSAHAEAPVGSTVREGSAGDEDDRSGGPCTCVGDCHASATTPVPLSGPDVANVLAARTSGAAGIGGRGRLTGHRHELFELHLPNAPPAGSPGSRRAIRIPA